MTYKIVELKNTYTPDLQGDRQPIVLDEAYENYTDTQDAVYELDHEVYVTSNNEADRPDYLIVEEIDADYVEDGRNMDMGNYNWSESECDCGECSDCCEMMISQDRAYLRQAATLLSKQFPAA